MKKALALIGLSASLFASAAQAGTLSLVVENDSVGGTDRNYTNGLLLSYLFEDRKGPDLAYRLADSLWGQDEEGPRHFSIALGHSIYTAESRTAVEPRPDEHPYSAWLYIQSGLTVAQKNYTDVLKLEIGVVGPAAIGEQVQNNFHDIIGVEQAEGWDNQLRNEPGLVTHFERTWNGWGYENEDGFGARINPHVGASLGNILIEARTGFTLSLGRYLDAQFPAARIEPGLALPSKQASDKLYWNAFIGLEGRAVAHNLFLDGSSFRDSLSVDRKPFTGDIQFGITMGTGQVSGSFAYIVRAKEFETQTSVQQYGSFTLSYHF